MRLFATKNQYLRTTIYIVVLLCLFSIQIVSAETKEYLPITNLPGLTGTTSIVDFINRAYELLIVAGAIFGVLKIAFSGVRWTTSDVVSDKHDALHDIQGVLLGLGILLIPFIVLNTIYSPLTDLNILKNIKAVQSDESARADRIENLRAKNLEAMRSLSATCAADGKVLVNHYNPGTNVEAIGAFAHQMACVDRETLGGTMGEAESIYENCTGTTEACMERCQALGGTYAENENQYYVARGCRYTGIDKCTLKQNGLAYDCFTKQYNTKESCATTNDDMCQEWCDGLHGVLRKVSAGNYNVMHCEYNK